MIKSYSTIQHFDSVKWKKRLIKLSHKLHRSHHNHQHHRNANSSTTMPTTSATALAAATEKFIRHTPSEIVIHSEDLTASQFANMTGIKTKRNSLYPSHYNSDRYEDDDDEEELDSDEDDEDSRDYYYSTTSVSSSSKQPYQPIMRIWDSHFWQDGNAPAQHRKSLPVTSTELSAATAATAGASNRSMPSAASMGELSTIASTKPTTALTSQPLCRHASEPGGNKVPSMIQKGRFKIVWGNDDEETLPVVAPTSHCVEWKRKRAGSSSSAAI